MSFRARILTTLSLLLSLGFGLGGTLLLVSNFSAVLQQQKSAALRNQEMALNTLSLLGQSSSSLFLSADSASISYTQFASILEQMDEESSARWVAVRLRFGDTILYESAGAAAWLSLAPSSGELTTVSQEIVLESAHYLQLCTSLSTGSAQLLLDGMYDISSAYTMRHSQMQLFTVIYVVVCGVGLLLSWWLSASLTRPLQQLGRTARRIAQGDLKQRAAIVRQDEIGALATDFNCMADQLAENIQHLEGELERQNAFLGAFTHELKTPMTSIIGYADLLQQGSLNDVERMEAAHYIYTEGQRLEKLSLQLLDLLLLEKDEPTVAKVELSGLLSSIRTALGPSLAKKNIKLICRYRRGAALLAPDLVQSLLYNLVDNASKAIEGEGSVYLYAEPLEEGGCRFLVRDTGRGMPQEELKRITEAFYRVDKARSRRQGGAGLGLALCSRIVALHQGRLTFQSQVGVGTLVTVVLHTPEVKSS